MKNILLALLFIVVLSCKEEAKKETVAIDETKTTEKVEEVVSVTYPNLDKAPVELNYVFENGFEFAQGIKINYIAINPIEGDSYKIIYGLDSSTDLSLLESPLRVSSNFYAESPSLFKEKIYQDRKVRQIPSVCKVYKLDDEYVLTYNFSIIPKKFNQVKFYFYNDNGVINEKILTVRNIELPK
ncbi:hypothetical protein [uncultured Lacinutrix sp.]|uniref:hypothetical protein n=1 Tax=uncultured Lacinutrix sp. TaxID=574032 RepID=UPI0026267B2B|nr:hypothetical protein [uncultured Lacinutrix sp.]